MGGERKLVQVQIECFNVKYEKKEDENWIGGGANEK